jgi:hypothetical protein
MGLGGVATGRGGDGLPGQQEATVGLTTTTVAKIMLRPLFASVDLDLEKKHHI